MAAAIAYFAFLGAMVSIALGLFYGLRKLRVI
ncbi:MAG: cytochrome b6-f complex subunit PetL [Cyanobacteria bacterium P01_F01_bin.42]